MTRTPVADRSLLTTLVAAPLALLLLAASCPKKAEAPPAPSTSPSTAAPPAPSPFAAAPPGARVAVVFTASVQGYVEPCGCTGDPLGGVARLSGALDQARAAYGERVVFVDAGDLLFERETDNAPADRCQAEGRIELLLSTLSRQGLAATVRGPLDDVRGAAFRDAALAKHNVKSLDDGQGILVDAGGVRVGLVGIRADALEQIEPRRQELSTAVQKLVADGAQLVVGLAQAKRGLTRRIVSGVPGLDVVVQGHAPGEVPVAPEKLEGVVLVAAGMQAQHLGVLEAVLDGRDAATRLVLDDRQDERARRRALLDVRIAALDEQLKNTTDEAKRAFLSERRAAAVMERDEPQENLAPLSEPHVLVRSVPLVRGSVEEAQAAAALAAYEANIPALVASCEAALSCPPPPPNTARFMGVASCQSCHKAAAEFWRNQRVELPGKDEQGRAVVRTLSHAKAWETLVHDKKDRDRSCVGCHSVGFAVPGGACKTTDVVTLGLQGVQCESCHGAGSVHAGSGKKEDIVRDTPESTCRECHQVPHIPTTESFVFNEKLKLILGKGHGEARRATLR